MKIFSTVRHDFVNDQCVVSVAVLLNCSRRVVPKILIQYLVGGGEGVQKHFRHFAERSSPWHVR